MCRRLYCIFYHRKLGAKKPRRMLWCHFQVSITSVRIDNDIQQRPIKTNIFQTKITVAYVSPTEWTAWKKEITKLAESASTKPCKELFKIQSGVLEWNCEVCWNDVFECNLGVVSWRCFWSRVLEWNLVEFWTGVLKSLDINNESLIINFTFNTYGSWALTFKKMIKV